MPNFEILWCAWAHPAHTLRKPLTELLTSKQALPVFSFLSHIARILRPCWRQSATSIEEKNCDKYGALQHRVATCTQLNDSFCYK